MITLIAGSRSFVPIGTFIAVTRRNERTTITYIDRAIQESGFPFPTRVISGGARGVDRCSEVWARENGILFKPSTDRYVADWNPKPDFKYDSFAGFKRNTIMVGIADQAIIVWDGQSIGAYDTIQKMRQAGKPVYVFVPEENYS